MLIPNADTIVVELQNHTYPIYIGQNILSEEKIWDKHLSGKEVLIVTNSLVGPLFLPQLEKVLQNYSYDILVLPEGEQHKTLHSFQEIIEHAIKHQHHRDTTFIGLGGGVITDITGFAAACYQRGVNFIPVPTTLLAQVDASIGGKTGVNHAQGKNLIGAFYQPKAVIIDTNTLATLPAREFKSALAEIIKAALIADVEFFLWLENNINLLLKRDGNILAFAIQRACTIKRNIVMADEKEWLDQRVLLNLGHTFGHAIETCLGYGEWLHGEAVAVGLVLAAQLSVQLGMLPSQESDRIVSLLKKAGLPTHLPATDHEKLFATMQMDKKIINQQMRFVLLQKIGKAIVNAVNETEVLQLLNSYL